MDIRNNQDARRYELLVDDVVAGAIEYIIDGEIIEMPHTTVEPAFEGRGYASALAKYALDDARSRACMVRPTCSYLRRYIDKHEEYRDLVAE